MTLCCRCGKEPATQEISIGPLGSDDVAIYRTCATCASFVSAAIRGDPLFSRGEQGRQAQGAMGELLDGLKRTTEN